MTFIIVSLIANKRSFSITFGFGNNANDSCIKAGSMLCKDSMILLKPGKIVKDERIARVRVRIALIELECRSFQIGCLPRTRMQSDCVVVGLPIPS